ncbi:unnamed protein product [Polarella glacialis]|uniref:Uncharacterized protein n=1 Tax=Polarella glacialis TaxID=89957 RepID=A0A813GXN1_POLGL|nr:unnamed protein product [Polarella glacialis]
MSARPVPGLPGFLALCILITGVAVHEARDPPVNAGSFRFTSRAPRAVHSSGRSALAFAGLHGQHQQHVPRPRRTKGLQSLRSSQVRRALDGTGWPPVPALNPASEESLRLAVWTDFQLAVVFFVVTPLVLLGAGIWSSLSTGGRRDEVLRLVSGYWQCSSMLLITVLLNIGELQISAVTGLAAQIMILVSLWFWEDLTEALDAQEDALAAFVRTWRLIATAVAAAGAAANIPFQYCATVPSLSADAGCAAWIEAPLALRDILLPSFGQELSAQIGLLGLAIYTVYISYFAVFILPTTGRRGLATRPSFTWLSALEWLGLASPRDP